MEERPTDFWLDYIKIEYADAKDSPENNITKKREYETNNPGFRLEAPPEVNVSEWLLEAFCEFWAILTVCAEEALRKNLNESEDNESVSIVVDQIIENFKQDTALNRATYIVFLHYCVEYYVGNDAQKLIGDDQFKESIKVAGVMGLVEHFTGRLVSKCPIQGLISKHSDLFAKILRKYYPKSL